MARFVSPIPKALVWCGFWVGPMLMACSADSQVDITVSRETSGRADGAVALYASPTGSGST